MIYNIDPGSTAFNPRTISHKVTGGLTVLGLLGAAYAAVIMPDGVLPGQAKLFMIAWLALSVCCTFFIAPRHFVLGYLTGLFAMLVGWRIAGLHGVTFVTWPLLIAFAAFVLQFFDCLRADRGHGASSVMSASDWHLTFLRIYIGFDMVPHFTEKLFAGPGTRQEDVTAFANFGLPMPEAFVILGGLCEIGIAIGIGMGLLTRLAALCSILYFLVATLIGGHFGLGFIWASAGGGWEYPVLMMVLFLSFMVRGGSAFSIDRTFGLRSIFASSRA